MSPSIIVDLVAGVWLFVVLVLAIETLAPLMVGPPPPRTGRKLLRLSVLTAALAIVIRVAASGVGQ